MEKCCANCSRCVDCIVRDYDSHGVFVGWKPGYDCVAFERLVQSIHGDPKTRGTDCAMFMLRADLNHADGSAE